MKKGISVQQAEKIRVARGLGKGTKLRILRVQRGISQRELAERANVPLRTLEKFENFETRIDRTRLETLCNLSLALDCQITDILENEDLIEKFNQVK